MTLGGLSQLSFTRDSGFAGEMPQDLPVTSQIPKSKAVFVFSPDKSIFLNWIWEEWIVKWYLCSFKTNGIRISSGLAYKQLRNIPLLQQRATETLNQTKLFLHCSGKISLLSSCCIHCYFPEPCLFTWHGILFEYPLSQGQEDVLCFQVDYSI